MISYPEKLQFVSTFRRRVHKEKAKMVADKQSGIGPPSTKKNEFRLVIDDWKVIKT